MCTVSNNIETRRLKYYTCPPSFTPLASKAYIPQRCGRDYTKETGISRQHPAARRGNGANRKTCHNNTVTSRQYGRRAIYVSGDVRFQDGDAFDIGKLGGGDVSFHLFLLSFNVCTCASLFCNKVHIYDYSCIRYNGPCNFGVLFMYDSSQCAWRISPIRFNNVKLSPLIRISNIAGLLRPRVLKPPR